MTTAMGRKARLKKTKKRNRKEEVEIVAVFRKVQAATKELRSLAKDE